MTEQTPPLLHEQTKHFQVWHGDCIDTMRLLPAESVHAVVTDPPYGIAFMGKQWDQPGEFGSTRRNGTPGQHLRDAERARAHREYLKGPTGVDNTTTTERGAAMEAGRYDLSPSAMRNFQRWCELWATECLRVLKPGGHLLAFGGSRTWHRLAAGIEDAGFEMRDSIAWLYGSGFPKSLDVSKAIDKAAGEQRGRNPDFRNGPNTRQETKGADYMGHGAPDEASTLDSGAVTDAARQWDGWGTALKPAFEPIVVARKPLQGTVAANVLAHGTGALHIDATRIGTDGGAARYLSGAEGTETVTAYGDGLNGAKLRDDTVQGRWPANVVLDESQAAALDAQSGYQRDGLAVNRNRTLESESRGTIGPAMPKTGLPDHGFGGAGGASRFFPTFRYTAKAPSSERPQHVTEDGENTQHPTVKPLGLMQWLVRLVTPPDGTVLEPFAGSGTTVEACLREGFGCIAIEREADYLPLIVKRTRKDHPQTLFGDL